MIDQSPVLATAERLLDVARYDLDDRHLRVELDALAADLAKDVGTPAAAITVLLDTVQCFAGAHGMTGLQADVGGTPIEWAFCAQVGTRKAPYVVEDATTDPIQHDSPLVTREGVRAYAGVPIVSPHGQVIGAACVTDGVLHRFTDADVAILHAAAERAVEVLERHTLQ